MIFLIMLVLAILGFAIRQASLAATKTRVSDITEQALAKAKEGLIAYAVAHGTQPGLLPCPDLNNTGQDASPANDQNSCPTLVGRLPWQTLGLPDLRDGYGEGLWYVLSDNFHHDSSVPRNSDTAGQITVTGVVPQSNVAAVVFSPGPALGTQNRIAANINDVSHYLEGTNATSTINLVTGNVSGTFNDRLITILPADIFRPLEKRVAHEIIPLLNKYYADWGGRYPFATTFSNPSISNFKGILASDDGLLPVTNATGFVDWRDDSSGFPRSSMNAGLIPLIVNCDQDGALRLTCSAFVIGVLGIGSQVTVTAYANNVGMAFVDPVPLSSIHTTPTLNNLAVTQTMDSSGRGVITITGRTTGIITFGFVTVVIDRPPQYSGWVATGASSWITKNRWQNVIYYSVAASLTPDGGGSCSLAVNPCLATPPVQAAGACLSLCNRNDLSVRNDAYAVITMTGPALSGHSHPSPSLSDYLDADGNAYGNPSVGDAIYESKLLSATFNDQPYVVAP